MDGCLLRARLCEPTVGNLPGVKTLYSLYTPQKSFGGDCTKAGVPLVPTLAKRALTLVTDPVVHVRVWWIIETLKHLACTVAF